MNAQESRRQQVITLARLAPHADKQWIEDFVVELRLLDIPGDRIGDALATVEEHLVDTGEGVEEAFGPAKAYAAAIAESEARGGGISPTTILSSTLGVLGIILAPRVVSAALAHTAVEVTTGDLAALGLLAVLITGVIAFATPILRTVVERRVLGFVLWMAGGLAVTAAMVSLFLLWRTSLFALDPWLVGAMALACVGAAAWLSWRQSPDLVATPDGRTLGGQSTARVVNTLIFPGLTLIMCLVSWLTWSLT